jgi:hypothetical protein
MLRALAPGGTRMFQFDDRFHEAAPASLELGRSFVLPEHQNSFHGLTHPGHERQPHCSSRFTRRIAATEWRLCAAVQYLVQTAQ